MYKEVKEYLDSHRVKLVAISKTKSIDQIMNVYEQGQRVFGENRVQELVSKHDQMPKDILWHMVGHLQKNKVKYIAPFVDAIHSVDKFELLQVIDKQAARHDRKIKIFLQLKIAKEETKSGFDSSKLEEFLESNAFDDFKNIEIIGLMGMGTFTTEEQVLRKEFSFIKRKFDEYKSMYFGDSPQFTEISLGMSGDYKLAIEHGSTVVRIGSLIFGARNN